MNCSNCAAGRTTPNTNVITCMRHPPVPLLTDTFRDSEGKVINIGTWAVFPVLKPDGWCFEHVPKN